MLSLPLAIVVNAAGMSSVALFTGAGILAESQKALASGVASELYRGLAHKGGVHCLLPFISCAALIAASSD